MVGIHTRLALAEKFETIDAGDRCHKFAGPAFSAPTKRGIFHCLTSSLSLGLFSIPPQSRLLCRNAALSHSRCTGTYARLRSLPQSPPGPTREANLRELLRERTYCKGFLKRASEGTSEAGTAAPVVASIYPAFAKKGASFVAHYVQRSSVGGQE